MLTVHYTISKVWIVHLEEFCMFLKDICRCSQRYKKSYYCSRKVLTESVLCWENSLTKQEWPRVFLDPNLISPKAREIQLVLWKLLGVPVLTLSGCNAGLNEFVS